MEVKMDNSVMFNVEYGLYLLTAKSNGKDNGCIVNSFMQVTPNPNIAVCGVSKSNLTHDMIAETGIFNLSILDTRTNMSLIKRFGYQSGRTADKFEGFKDVAESSNGLKYLTCCSNSYISCKVVSKADMGTHTLFTAEVTDAVKLIDTETLTYNYYRSKVKPNEAPPKKKGWICKICGYIYEGEELPADYICPICKHGAQDFERLS